MTNKENEIKNIFISSVFKRILQTRLKHGLNLDLKHDTMVIKIHCLYKPCGDLYGKWEHTHYKYEHITNANVCFDHGVDHN